MFLERSRKTKAISKVMQWLDIIDDSAKVSLLLLENQSVAPRDICHLLRSPIKNERRRNTWICLPFTIRYSRNERHQFTHRILILSVYIGYRNLRFSYFCKALKSVLFFPTMRPFYPKIVICSFRLSYAHQSWSSVLAKKSPRSGLIDNI